MDVMNSLAIISLAALIHASFQLSISVLTLLSGHTITTQHSQARLLRLTTSFVIGAVIMTLLLLSTTSLVLLNVFGTNPPYYVWASGCGLMFGVSLSIWIFYYRREKGTMIWIPRSMADYLTKRTKSTKLSAEAFGLGLSSVFGELLFIIAPIFIASLTIIQLPPIWQLIGLGAYTIISMLSLLIVWVLISSGYNLGKVQKWRESNKYFLQFAAGAGLFILGYFVYVNVILTNLTGGI